MIGHETFSLSDQEPVILDSKVIPGMGETQNLQVDDNVINTLAPSKVRFGPWVQ